MIVDRFGLHMAAGIPFLLQSTGGSNLISPELKCPIQVHVTPRRTLCPHQVDLDTWTEVPEWVSDPLANIFLPIPRGPDEKVRAVLDPDGAWERLAFRLQRLCSPTGGLARPIWGCGAHESVKWYRVSNLSPMVFVGVELQHAILARKHMGFAKAYNRRTVLFLRERIPLYNEVEWVNSQLTLSDLQDQALEAIGSGALRATMDRYSE